MKVNKCCCCIKVKTGVYAIGMWHVICMVAGLFSIDLVRVTLEIFTAIAFVVMVVQDNANTR